MYLRRFVAAAALAMETWRWGRYHIRQAVQDLPPSGRPKAGGSAHILWWEMIKHGRSLANTVQQCIIHVMIMLWPQATIRSLASS